MSLAIRVEDKVRAQSGRNLPVNSRNQIQTTHRSSSTGVLSGSPLITPVKTTFFSPRTSNSSNQNSTTGTPAQGKPGGKIRRLSDKEWQFKREKGLCFKCDEKWNIGHRCRRKELSVLITYEEDDIEEEQDKGPDEEPQPATDENPILSGICLNSFLGVANPKTLKIRGQIKDRSW
ncbi:hypothetical protein LXL04_028334 [Taraxacum kok-saghyz]